MDPEWEIYLFICIFQFSFVLASFFPFLFGKPFGFIASPGVLLYFLFFNIQSPYFNMSLCSDFSDTVYSVFSLQIVEIMKWTVKVTVNAQITSDSS